MKSILKNQPDPLFSALSSGKASAATVVADILANKPLLESILRGISHSQARVKFGCSKSLLLLSESRPELLYPKFERIEKLLESDNQILKWTAIAVLGNLAAVDPRGRTRKLLPKLYGLLSCGNLIAANHAIAALAKIGRVFPDEQGAIVGRLIGIEDCSFETDECRNIALGKAILALDVFVSPARPGRDVVEFARRQADNKRSATAKKAKAFIKKLSPSDSHA